MSDASTYSVISTGKIQDEFGLDDVQENFATLFKTSLERASTYFGVQNVLKKDVGLREAQAFKKRLEEIGMVIELEENKPFDISIDSLSLVEKEPPKSENSMTCPKCDMQQEKAEQCISCGIYVKKMQAPSS